jgi:hypothetical protein
VHDHSWNEIACHIVQCDGGELEKNNNINLKFLKYLGIKIDIEATGTRAHDALLQNARAWNYHLLQQSGSSDVKID